MRPAFWTDAMMMTAPVAAKADAVCKSSAELEASLIDWYKDAPVKGVDQQRMQMWASDETGT